MHDVLTVQIVYGLQSLEKECIDFWNTRVASLHQLPRMIFEEATIWGIFHDHVDVDLIAQSVPQFNYMRMVELWMHLDFALDNQKLRFLQVRS